jgi:flagellin
MSGITLSSSVRQNLLSLQSTADLLSTTQSRLSTGNKVNSALDNPTNFFTAQSLNNRASDINNLLDGIGNGVQILQAANTGITSLQKLVDSAKSLANQALQTPTGYSTKSSVSTTVTGATADNLLGTTAYSNTSAASNVIFDGTSGGTTGVSLTDTLGGTAAAKVGTAITTLDTPADATGTAGAGLTITSGTTSAAATGTTLISALTNGAAGVVNGPAAGDQLTVDGKTITFTASGTAAADSNGNYTIGIDQSIDTLLDTVDTINGNTGKTSAVTGGAIVLSSGTNRKLEVSDNTGGTVLAKLGLSAANANTVAIGGAATTNASITTSTKLFNTVGGLSTTAISDGTTLTVSGKTITFKAEAPPAA